MNWGAIYFDKFSSAVCDVCTRGNPVIVWNLNMFYLIGIGSGVAFV
jgi:hypothetical protein